MIQLATFHVGSFCFWFDDSSTGTTSGASAFSNLIAMIVGKEESSGGAPAIRGDQRPRFNFFFMFARTPRTRGMESRDPGLAGPDLEVKGER